MIFLIIRHLPVMYCFYFFVLQEEDDSASVTSLDPKTREWLVQAAKGEYQVLAKLAAENPKLVRTKVRLRILINNVDVKKTPALCKMVMF